MPILNLRNGIAGPGSIAKVIFDPTRELAYKLFKSNRHPEHIDQPPTETQIREIFAAEHEAYRIITGRSDLQKHTPKYYGNITVDKVLDLNGQNVSDHFVLDCCLVLERLTGEDRKLNEVRSLFCYLDEFVARLKDAGVAYALDASVFNPADAEQFKLIDFSKWNAMDSL